MTKISPWHIPIIPVLFLFCTGESRVAPREKPAAEVSRSVPGSVSSDTGADDSGCSLSPAREGQGPASLLEKTGGVRATSSGIYTRMNNLVSLYPQLCTKQIYGYTDTHNRELCAIKISDNAATDENEPGILFDGGIHGNEYAGTDLTIRFAEYLCANYGSNSTVTNLINSREIWFFCMVNPEGRDLATRGNGRGFDLNKAFGYMQSGGFTEEETRAVRDCLLDNQFAIHLTYHASSEYLLFPWSFSGTDIPDKTFHKQIADLYSTTSGHYLPRNNIQAFYNYPSNGDLIDFSYGTLGNLAFHVQMINGQTTALNDTYFNYNALAMLKMIEYAGYGIEGVVADQATKAPVAAIILVNSSFPVYTDPAAGDFHKYVPAGTCSLTVIANGYKPETINNIIVADQSTTTVNVQLQKETHNQVYAYRVLYAESGTGITPAVLGRPDDVTFSGTVVVDMQFDITGKPGNDIKVHTTGAVTCRASKEPDGPWHNLGTGTEFDLLAGGLTSARYFKLSGGAIDAVEATHVTADPCEEPAIVSHPSGKTIAAGQTATLTVTASGTPALLYQWYEGSKGETGKPAGSVGSSFVTPALNVTTRYWVRVTNACGSADSDAAVVECYSLLGSFSIGGYLGTGTASPERAIHIRGQNAVFRMDRPRDSAAFMIVRNNDAGSVLKTFLVGVNATGINQGGFIINDLGSVTSGGGINRLTIGNTGIAGFGSQVRATSFITASSRRLKTRIQAMTGALAALQRLQGYRFNWKASGDEGVGFIAEELAAGLPILTVLDGERPAGVDPARVTALLLESIKEQQAEINHLKTQRKRLEQLLAELLRLRPGAGQGKKTQ